MKLEKISQLRKRGADEGQIYSKPKKDYVRDNSVLQGMVRE